MHTAVELPTFQKRAENLLTREEREAIIEHLASNPKAGAIIRETGGIRKLRWGKAGSGKSGGVRTIYFYKNENMPLFLLTVYPKNEKDNLTKAERNTLRKVTAALEQEWEKRK